MKQSNESHGIVRQNDRTVQKSQKHDTNLRKNSTLYFQVGLIMCLLASYTALEMSFATTLDTYVAVEKAEIKDVSYTLDKYKIYEEPKPAKAEPKAKKTAPITDEIKIKDNKDVIDNVIDPTTETPTVDTPVVLSPDDNTIDVPIEEDMTILAVQQVPVYPGCEKAENNDARRKCMSEKLKRFVSKKFDPDLGSDLGLTGKQRVYVSFKINKAGEVELLNINGKNDDLKKEAARVMRKVPTMQPGMNNNKPVNVLYTLPITLNLL